MAEFTMNAEITLKANAAIKAIQNFEKGAKGSKKEFSLLGRTIKLDAGRIKKSIFAMTAVLGGFFGKIFKQSPHIRAEFKRLEASTLLFNVALGEKLAPTVAIFVDGIIFLQQAFLSLPDPMQEWLLLTGLITVAIGILTLAVLALMIAISPITLAILGVSLAIAALIVFAPDIEGFGQTITDFGKNISSTLVDVRHDIDKTIREFFSQFGTFGVIIGDMVTLIVDAILLIPIFLADMIATGIQMLGDFMKAIGRLFQGDFGGFADALGDMFIRMINLMIRTLNSFLISPLNQAMRLIDDVAEAFGGDLNFRINEIPEISRQEGGEVRRDGLIFAHRGEEVATKSQTRANRRGNNGGGQVTINNYNTFKIASVDSKSRIREMMKEADRLNKRNMDRRFKT